MSMCRSVWPQDGTPDRRRPLITGTNLPQDGAPDGRSQLITGTKVVFFRWFALPVTCAPQISGFVLIISALCCTPYHATLFSRFGLHLPDTYRIKTVLQFLQ